MAVFVWVIACSFVFVFSFNFQAFLPTSLSFHLFLSPFLISCLALSPRCCIVVECYPPSHSVCHDTNFSSTHLYPSSPLAEWPASRTKSKLAPGLAALCLSGRSRTQPGFIVTMSLNSWVTDVLLLGPCDTIARFGPNWNRTLFIVYHILKHFIILIALNNPPPRKVSVSNRTLEPHNKTVQKWLNNAGSSGFICPSFETSLSRFPTQHRGREWNCVCCPHKPNFNVFILAVPKNYPAA